MRKIETTPHATTDALVQDALKHCGYTYSPQTGWTITGAGAHESDPLNIMASKVRRYLEQTKSPYIPPKDSIISAIELLEHTHLSDYTKQCYAAIQYDPSAKDTSESLARKFAGANYHPVYPSILRQILWSVKTKMHGKFVKCPIMAIFYGTAGTGKSTVVQRLTSVLPTHKYAFIKDGDSLINKEKSTQMIADTLILHLDEMSGMSKADLAKIKSLDAPYLTYIPLYVNSPKRVFNRSTLIGCSNSEVRNILHSTGNNRKWAQLDFYTPPTDNREVYIRERIQQILDFDYLNLWRSVNENDPEPFADPTVYDAYRRHVEETCNSSTPTTDWLDEYISDHAGDWVKKTDLYAEYKDECETETKHISKDKFYELCAQRGLVTQRRGMNGDRGFIIPSQPKEEEF